MHTSEGIFVNRGCLYDSRGYRVKVKESLNTLL